MAKKILLIGGNGYIGSRLTHDLQYTYDLQSVDICWFGKNLGFNNIMLTTSSDVFFLEEKLGWIESFFIKKR
jgi:UDP-glucose 4-epimerase